MSRTVIIILVLLMALPLAGGAAAGPDRSDFDPRLSGAVVNFAVRSTGSQYHHEEWLRGDVLLYSGEVVPNQELRYNGYRDALVWLHPETRRTIWVDEELVREFSLYDSRADRHMVFERFAPGRQSRAIYAERLFMNHIGLYVHRRVEQTGETTELRDNALRPVLTLEPRPVYYIVREGEAVVLARLNRRFLLNLFPDHRREVRSILRQNRLNVRNEYELVRAVVLIDAFLKDASGAF
jgi:hypothetical protein